MMTVARCLGSVLAVTVLAAASCSRPEPIRLAAPATPVLQPRQTTSPDATPGAVVRPPQEPIEGEVARFWFARPGVDKVAVGPYAVGSRILVVRGACRSASGSLTWRVFDNSKSPEHGRVRFLDRGKFVCDGELHQGVADVGAVREIGILGRTGARRGHDAGESAWLLLASEEH